jgi:hypothetical protein
MNSQFGKIVADSLTFFGISSYIAARLGVFGINEIYLNNDKWDRIQCKHEQYIFFEKVNIKFESNIDKAKKKTIYVRPVKIYGLDKRLL